MRSVRRAAAFKVFWQAMGGARRAGAPGFGTRMRAVPRMVSQGVRGRYPYLDKSRIGVAALGLVYVISPVDFVPEIFLPLLGLGDDAEPVIVRYLNRLSDLLFVMARAANHREGAPETEW